MSNRAACLSRPRALIAILLTAVVAACSSGSPAATTSTTSGPADSQLPGGGGQTSPAASASDTRGHLGDDLVWTSSGGNEVDVTLVKLTDPASPASGGTAATSGTRWVGVEMTILDHEGDASNFNSVTADGLGSDGTHYGANTSYHLGSFAGCTPSSGYTAGRPETFCAGFMVPTGVTVRSVGYSVVGVDSGASDDLTWTVP